VVVDGIVYHSAAYKQAPKSNSHTVAFWHVAPGAQEPVKHFGSIRYFLALEFAAQKILIAMLVCHNSVPSPAGLEGLQLAQKQPSGLSCIPAASLQSRVFFINNSKLPEGTLYVSPDVDHTYEYV
jgi:hypothetical protein